MNKEFLKELRKKRILILGFAKSGYQTAKVLNKLGVKVTLNSKEDLTNSKKAKELENLGVKVISGEHPLKILDNVDLIIKNPGIRYDIEIIKRAIDKKIKIYTEVEIAYRLFDNRIIAITGTNGKTTTTTLTYKLIKTKYNNAKVAGNIGFPLIKQAYENEKNDAPLVTEISSFQLNGTEFFKPSISVITNLGKAHLDYHGSVENYHNIKKRIFKNQDENDILILNIKDKLLYKDDNIKAKILYYSIDDDEKADIFIKNQKIVYKNDNIIDITKILLPGRHNLENVITAVLISLLEGVKKEQIQRIVYNFVGVEHRLQYLGEVKHIKFYNDSKATNPESTVKAITGFKDNIILIAGGKDRGIDFSELKPYLSRIKLMICIGESKNILEKLAKSNNVKCMEAIKVEDATILAYQNAKENDIILLSPACASWDQYPNFECRGKEFINIYKKIENKENN